MFGMLLFIVTMTLIATVITMWFAGMFRRMKSKSAVLEPEPMDLFKPEFSSEELLGVKPIYKKRRSPSRKKSTVKKKTKKR